MRKTLLGDLRDSELFNGVRRDEARRILQSLDAQLKNYRKGQTILSAGSRVRRIALIMEGSVSLFQTDFWGRRILIDSRRSGQIFAEAFACDRHALSSFTVQADEATVILWFDIMDILRVDAADESRTALIRNIMNTLAVKNLALNEKLLHVSRRSTKEKLLSYLSDEARKAGSSEFDIPFSRQELADYIGVDRSAMSAELSKLAREGYFETNRSHFVLKKL